MSTSGKLITAVVIVVVVAGAAVLLTSRKTDNTSNGTNSQTNNGDQAPAPAEVSIRYDGEKFILSADSVAAGGTVHVTNDSDKQLEFDSDPHPVHTDNKELNMGEIAPGESKSFTLNNKGKWGFHNHQNSSQKGELTVR